MGGGGEQCGNVYYRTGGFGSVITLIYFTTISAFHFSYMSSSHSQALCYILLACPFRRKLALAQCCQVFSYNYPLLDSTACVKCRAVG
jgi:hypothetical protein